MLTTSATWNLTIPTPTSKNILDVTDEMWKTADLETELINSYVSNPVASPANWKDYVNLHPGLTNGHFKVADNYNETKFIGASPRSSFNFAYHAVFSTDEKQLLFPLFKNHDLFSNVYFGGGFALDIFREVNQETRKATDIDLYIVGLDEKKTLLKVVALLSAILKQTYTKGAPSGHVPRVVRSQTALTISFGRSIRSIQICLSRMRDPLELLLSFDIAPCKFAVEVNSGWGYFSPTAGWVLYHKVYPVIVTELCGPALPYRLKKYRNRGCTFFIKDGEIYQKYLAVSAFPEEKVEDSQYNTVDLWEEDIILEPKVDDGVRERSELKTEQDYASAREIWYHQEYLKSRNFIIIRYRGDKDLLPRWGWGWDVASFDLLWYFLNDVESYLLFQHRTAPRIYKEVVLPGKALEGEVKTLSLFDLIELLKTRTLSKPLPHVVSNGSLDKGGVTVYSDGLKFSFTTDKNGASTKTFDSLEEVKTCLEDQVVEWDN